LRQAAPFQSASASAVITFSPCEGFAQWSGA
jgi:hypothetical protein